MWFATFKDDDKLTHTLKTITTTEKNHNIETRHVAS